MNKIIISILILFFNISMFIFPKEIIEGTKNGLYLWLNNIIPVLFPFIVFNNILRETKALTALPNLFFMPIAKVLSISPNTAKYYLLAILTGYPLGLKISSELYKNKEISKEEFKHIIKFFNNASIVFIVGTVGVAFYDNKNIGILLYTVHICSSIILGICYSNKVPDLPIHSYTKVKSNSSVLPTCIIEGFYSTISIGGFVIFFSFIGEVLRTSKFLELVDMPFIPQYQVQHIFLGLLEFTNGIHGLATNAQTDLTLPLISFLLGFGGLSVTMQSLSFLKDIDISPLTYIKSKLNHGFLSFFLTYFITKFIFLQSETVIKIETHFKDTAKKRYLHNDFIANNIEFHPVFTMMILSLALFILFMILTYISNRRFKKRY